MANPPERITIGFLSRYPEFAAFRRTLADDDRSPDALLAVPGLSPLLTSTPEERLEVADRDLKRELAPSFSFVCGACRRLLSSNLSSIFLSRLATAARVATRRSVLAARVTAGSMASFARRARSRRHLHPGQAICARQPDRCACYPGLCRRLACEWRHQGSLRDHKSVYAASPRGGRGLQVTSACPDRRRGACPTHDRARGWRPHGTNHPRSTC